MNKKEEDILRKVKEEIYLADLNLLENIRVIEGVIEKAKPFLKADDWNYISEEIQKDKNDILKFVVDYQQNLEISEEELAKLDYKIEVDLVDE